MKIKKIVSCLLVILISFIFIGCSNVAKFNSYKELENKNSFNGTVAENENYVFDWDKNYNRVVLKSKSNGDIVWSSIPDEICLSSENTTDTYFSPVTVSYLEPATNQVKTINGASGIESVSIEKNNNKLKAYYYFNSVEICVPVVYSLEEDGFSVEINANELTEGKYKIYQIAVLPYNVSTANDNNKENWLFVPYGSGAIMYTDDAFRNERKFEEDVYGIDYSITRDEVFNSDTSIKLPVFAAGNTETSIFAVIESGAEYATLSAFAGNSGLKYSNIVPSFRLRGYNITNVQYAGKTGGQIVRISDSKVSDILKIRYHLINEGKNFIKMASIYRKYLDNVYGEQKQNVDNPIYLNFIGGASTVEYVAGIKNTKLKAATTFGQISDIIDDFESICNIKPLIALSGFGRNGIEIGQIAGGFEFENVFGSKKDLNSLLSENDVLIDYELIKFDKSGNGFSSLWDSSKNANNGSAKQFEYDLATKVSNDAKTYRLLRRDMIKNAAKKMIKANEDIKSFGISTGSLGYTAYSDYSKSEYTSKGFIDKDVNEIVKNISNEGYRVAVRDANDYAAVNADIILDTPVDKGTLACLDQSVPFYAMVFKGYTQLYTKSLNLSDDLQKTIIDSVSSGIGIQYTLCNDADSLRNSIGSALFAQSVYSDIKMNISETLNSCVDLLNKVSTAKITDWFIEKNGVSVTKFDNGITVYCNYSESEVQTPCGQIPSMGFAFSEGR